MPIKESNSVLTPIPMYIFLPHTTKEFSDTGWISYNLTQFSHYLETLPDPKAKGSVPEDCGPLL